MRLIDADALEKRLDNEKWMDNYDRDFIVDVALDEAPTVDIMADLRCNHCGYKQHSKAISNLKSCNDCGIQNACTIKPKPGEWCRINCYFWRKKY